MAEHAVEFLFKQCQQHATATRWSYAKQRKLAAEKASSPHPLATVAMPRFISIHILVGPECIIRVFERRCNGFTGCVNCLGQQGASGPRLTNVAQAFLGALRTIGNRPATVAARVVRMLLQTIRFFIFGHRIDDTLAAICQAIFVVHRFPGANRFADVRRRRLRTIGIGIGCLGEFPKRMGQPQFPLLEANLQLVKSFFPIRSPISIVRGKWL